MLATSSAAAVPGRVAAGALVAIIAREGREGFLSIARVLVNANYEVLGFPTL
jgi:hypothetical protein